jgi:hypothetical protein
VISFTIFGICNQSARLIIVPCSSLEDAYGACGFTLRTASGICNMYKFPTFWKSNLYHCLRFEIFTPVKSHIALYHEDGGNMFFRNISINISVYIIS